RAARRTVASRTLANRGSASVKRWYIRQPSARMRSVSGPASTIPSVATGWRPRVSRKSASRSASRSSRSACTCGPYPQSSLSRISTGARRIGSRHAAESARRKAKASRPLLTASQMTIAAMSAMAQRDLNSGFHHRRASIGLSSVNGSTTRLSGLACKKEVGHGVDRPEVVDVDVLLPEREIVGLFVPHDQLQDRRRVEIACSRDDVGITEGGGVDVQCLRQFDHLRANSCLDCVSIELHALSIDLYPVTRVVAQVP